MADTFQIAAYPFRIGLYPQLTAFERVLTQVLAAFRVLQPPSSPVPPHDPFEYYTRFGMLRSAADQNIYQVDIHLDPDADWVDPIRLVDAFEPQIVNQAVRESPLSLWIHGACLLRGKEPILLVASTGAGKTTLSLGLLHQGYRLLTDDIILVNPETQQLLPLPRCPKYRADALENLRSIGFDLEYEARTLGHYVLLPPRYFQLQPVAHPIRRVYALQRDTEAAPGLRPLSLSDGLLALIPHSNLLAIDPELTLAARLFAETQFWSMNLSDFAGDIRQIAL
ncbi:MAG: hypothetical protein K8J31_04245 [Anaerolineae bacterium]|nr:hypothetical protein [Anaerolineae bacterium]